MSTRVYLPGDWDGLGEVVGVRTATADPDFSIGWSGRAHAVTAELRERWPDADEEQWEYVAAQEAANDSLGGVSDEEEPPRRLVLVVEADSCRAVADGRPTEVEVPVVEVPGAVVAYLVDDPAAGADVAEAVRLLRTGASAEALETALDRCAEHPLAWYDASELDVLLGAGRD